METAALIGLVYFTLATGLSFYVLTRRREPAITMAWILGFYLLPYFGVLLYMFFGYRRYRRKLKPKPHPCAEAVPAREFRARFHVPAELESEVSHLATLAERLTGFPVVPGNKAECFLDPAAALQAICEAIDQARHHVHLSFYIVRDDAAGRAVAQRLAHAARRGVRCRFLIDSVGSLLLGPAYTRPLREVGVEVIFFSPLKRFKRLWHLHLRNHRKLVVVDGKAGFIGSQNLTDTFSSVPPENREWLEIAMRIEGPAVGQLQSVFAEDWRFSTGKVLDKEECYPAGEPAGDLPMQMIPTGPDLPEQSLHLIFLSLIHAAQKNVTIVTPYLVPTQPVALALESAARRGVRVSILLPKHSDNRLARLAGRSWYPALLEAGVDIYEHALTPLHAKAILIDEHMALVGSANIDARSFQLNFEAGVIVFGPEPAISLQRAAERMLSSAEPVRLSGGHKSNPWAALTEGVARLLSPLL